MHIECRRESLVQTLTHLGRLVGKNLTLPLLATILFEAEKDNLTLRATNLDVGAEVTIPVKVLTPGRLAVPVVLLNNFLNSVTGVDKITLEAKGGNLSITTGRHRTTLKCLSADDFPTLPRGEADQSVHISGPLFSLGIKAVGYAASPSEMKPEIASVYVYSDVGDIVFVATDSFRLAEKRLPFHQKSGEEFSKMLLPVKNALLLANLLEEKEETLLFGATKNQLTIASETLYASSRIIEGVFPDYQQIMPKKKTTEAVVLKEDFLGAMKIASLFAEKFFQVRLVVDPTAKKLTVHAEGEATGVHESDLDATLEGEALEMSFNARYILDAFSSLKEDSLTLSFGGKGRPMVIRGVGDNSFTYLAMPLNR